MVETGASPPPCLSSSKHHTVCMGNGCLDLIKLDGSELWTGFGAADAGNDADSEPQAVEKSYDENSLAGQMALARKQVARDKAKQEAGPAAYTPKKKKASKAHV